MQRDHDDLDRQHLDAVRRYLRRHLRDEGTVEDLTAAILRTACQVRPDLRAEITSWLLEVARDHLIDSARARAEPRDGQLLEALARRVGAVLVDVGPSAVCGTVDAGPVVQGEVRAALAALSRDEQDVLWLGAWGVLNSRGLGVVLGCSAGAARVRLHRARRRLCLLVLSV